MCGIAGSVDPRGVDPATLETMGDAIAHRGPDGEGYLLFDPEGGIRVGAGRGPLNAGSRSATVGFAHRRLAIIDLSEENHQPAVSADGRLALVFNGEIYNYIELRRELEASGHRFRTQGDTEVLLASYDEWGPACVERFVGMWAFAILDLDREVLFCSRDRFGIKPFHYAVQGNAFHFGSEIKALLAVPTIEPELNAAVLRRYLLAGIVDDTDRTFFAGINSLPPAHNLVLPLGQSAAPRIEQYWSPPQEGYPGTRRAAATEFAERLTDSVRLHARSDVPVGTCLSGGLDSSAIVCIAEELRRDGGIPSYAHEAFGYVPEDPRFSERRHMDAVVDQTGVRMTHVEFDAERFAEAIPVVARQQDEPFGSANEVAQWFVFEAARKAGMKVMLDGQGSDEMLAGYHSMFAMTALGLLRDRRMLGFGLYSLRHRTHHGTFPVTYSTVRAELKSRGAAPMALDPPPEPPPWASILTDEVRRELEPADYIGPQFHSAHELYATQTTSVGLPSLLRWEDRNSMAHSIEGRVPFLDHRLVEFVFRLPIRYRIDGAVTKRVMRDGLRGVLPEAIRTRSDKVGFHAEPSATWKLAHDHRDWLLSDRTDLEGRWFDKAALEDLIGSADRSRESELLLWRVINTKLWARNVWAGQEEALVS